MDWDMKRVMAFPREGEFEKAVIKLDEKKTTKRKTNNHILKGWRSLFHFVGCTKYTNKMLLHKHIAATDYTKLNLRATEGLYTTRHVQKSICSTTKL